MDTYHAAPRSDPYSSSDEEEICRYRNTHQPRTKQRGNRQQQQQQERQRYLENWTWEEILDDKGPWKQPGEYRRPKAELEAAKAERRHYEELARQRGWKPERQPKNVLGGGTQGVWRSQEGDLRQLPVLTGEREGLGRHRVMRWSAQFPQCVCIARCGTFQLLVSAGLEWASSQVP